MEQQAVVAAIEAAAYRSWRARECVEYDGWQLRFADGFSRRGNSVYPAVSSRLPLAEKLDWCRQWYRHRGLDLVFRQTIASEHGLDPVLEQAGFELEGRTDVMIGEVGSSMTECAVASAPSLAWWNTTSDLWGFDLGRSDGWAGIVGRIDRPAGFVCIDGQAAGMAIVDGEWLGLFEIIVASSAQRQGLGSAMTNALLDWGHGVGARRAYLQVVSDNRPAIEFYTGLGFERAYHYWYRRDRH